MKNDASMQYPTSELGRSLLVAQYEALRGEVGQRVDLRQQILTFTLIVASTLFGLGGQGWVSSLALLCYPLLALFLAGAWQQHDLRIGQIVLFLREQEHDNLGSASWETYRWRTFAHQNKHVLSHSRWRGSVALPSSGIFLVTQLLAMGIGISHTLPISPENLSMVILIVCLIIADAIAMLLTAYMLRHRRARDGQGQGETVIAPSGAEPMKG